MLLRLALVLALGLSLAGCMLKSKAPLFPESRGAMILGDKPLALRTFERGDGGAWKPSHPNDPDMDIRPEGRHYVASMQGEPETYPVTFVGLGDGLYVAQIIDKDRSAIYAFVKPDGAELLEFLLPCERLKAAAPPETIDFDGQDCTARPTRDPLALFRALRALPGEPDAKLVRVK